MTGREKLEPARIAGRTYLECVKCCVDRMLNRGDVGTLRVFCSPYAWESCCIFLGLERRPYSIEAVENRGIIVTHFFGRLVHIHTREDIEEQEFSF